MGEVRSFGPIRNPARFAWREQRTSLRFDVAGRLTGHLVSLHRPITVQNLGLGGFSAEVAWPVPSGPHFVQLVTPDNRTTLLETRSVYCRPSAGRDGRYSAGFEFVRTQGDGDRTIKGILEQVTPLRLGMMWV